MPLLPSLSPFRAHIMEHEMDAGHYLRLFADKSITLRILTVSNTCAGDLAEWFAHLGCSIACRRWSHSRAPNTPTRVREARAPQRHRGHRGRVPFSLLRALCGSVVKANRVGILIARTCTYHFRRPPL